MKYSHLLMLSALLPLTACGSGSVKQVLGLDRGAPDEFRVVSRPPLSVPPEFDLNPPDPTAASVDQAPISKQAKELVLGTGTDAAPAADTAAKPAKPKAKGKTKPDAGPSKADSTFLERAGAVQTNPGIRKELLEERYQRQQVEEEKKSQWWNVLPSWSDRSDPTVNPQKEDARIKTNEKEGKPVNEGETEINKGKAKSTLDYILGN